MPPHTLIVFSHLRWNFVYQRPQHLVSRLAAHYDVLYIEEPVESNGSARMEIREVQSGVRICTPHLPTRVAGFHDDHISSMQLLVEQLLRDTGTESYAVWFYTPMALPLIDELRPRALIYDCMDELSAFMNAPKQLVQRENALLKRADIVFTGGPSLYRSKRSRHPAVYCFPSSVDASHFSRARASASSPTPRLGFFGVLDERIDCALLGAIADARPDWSLQLVGPVVKIPEASLPRRANIEYLGQRSYDELPDLVASWDICLLPFALNEATRFISPTKTLEYMAAGKPVVSTAVADVVECHAEVVRIAHTHEAFVDACIALLAETPAERDRRERAAQATLENTSWDSTAEQMRNLIDKACSAGASTGAAVTSSSSRETARSPDDAAPAAAKDTVIIGAGPTGLSAAYHLGEGSLLLEANGTVGGWCRSIVEQGFTFDHAGHIMFSNDAYVHEMYRQLLGDNVHWQDREAWIFSKNVYTRYPFQGALYGLPAEVLKECIVGAIEARFGSIRESAPAPRLAASSSASIGKAESITDCCADGVADIAAPRVSFDKTHRAGKAEPRNFEEFIYQVWGAGVAKHFAIPYNRKLWAVPLNEMETSWLGGRVPLPDLEEMIDGALRPPAKPAGPNARFGYPLRGGFQALMDGFLPLLEGELQLSARVARVFPERKELLLEDGRRFSYQQLISTAPLPKLVEMTGDSAPAAVQDAAAGLRHVSVRCVNLGIARAGLTDKHWIYYPEDTVFHRIFVQGNASPHCNPPGGFGLTCEITYAPSKPLPCTGEALIDLCIADCIRTGLLTEEDQVIVRNQVDMPYAYVVYDHARKQNVALIEAWFAQHDIILSGRYSEWQYYNSDHAFLAGRTAAEKARANSAPRQLERDAMTL